MTASEWPCRVCNDEMTADGLLGQRCTAALRHALRELPELMDELVITRTRQAKVSTGGGGRGTSIPMPFGYDATWARDAIIGTVTTWIRELAEQYGEDLTRRTLVCGGHAATVVVDWAPGHTMQEYCAWLLARMYRIRGHVAVEQVYDELMNCIQAAKRAIDRPAEREFVTTCEICGEGVYGPAGADNVWIQCGSCRRVAERDDNGQIVGYVPEYQAGPERARRLAALREQVLPAAEVMIAVQALRHEEISPKTFRSWVRRWQEGVVGRASLPAVACRVEDGAPLYRVEDALSLAAMVASRAPRRNPRLVGSLQS